VEEEVQTVPIPVSVIGGAMIEKTAAFNVNRLKELIPTVQFYSSNPRNSAITIRGMGAPFGLTNDGIEPASDFMSMASSMPVQPPQHSISWISKESRSCVDRKARCSERTRPRAQSISPRGGRASRRNPISS
jgi:hypothetical protein